MTARVGVVLGAPLSPRELEVLGLIADGNSFDDIAAQLFLSMSTVKAHAIHLRLKLGARNSCHAVKIACDSGVLASGGVR